MSYKFSFTSPNYPYRELTNLSEETVYGYNIGSNGVLSRLEILPNNSITLVGNRYNPTGVALMTKNVPNRPTESYNGEEFLCFLFQFVGSSGYTSFRLYYLNLKEELTLVTDVSTYEFECILFPTTTSPLAYPQRLNN
nr:MAG TPA: hypothetical protein [Caudoviricetes sp.]